MRSVWTAWFRFDVNNNNNNISIDALFFHNILMNNAAAPSTGQAMKNIALKIHLQRLCIRMWIFILNVTNIQNSIFFNSPTNHIKIIILAKY